MSDELKEAYQLVKTGDHARAEIILTRYVKKNREDARAWWLLALATFDPKRKRIALLQVQHLKPDHEPSRKMLEDLLEEREQEWQQRQPRATAANTQKSKSNWLGLSLIAFGGMILLGLMSVFMGVFMNAIPSLNNANAEPITLFEFGVDIPTQDPNDCSFDLLGPPRVGSLSGLSSDSDTATFSGCSDSHSWTLRARADERYVVRLISETSGLDVYVLRVDSPPEADTVSISRASGTSTQTTFETTDEGDYRIIVRQRSAVDGTYRIEVDRR